MLLCNSDENEDKERKYIKTLLDKSVDGIIFISSGYDKNMHLIPEYMPIVAIDRKPNLNKVVTEERAKMIIDVCLNTDYEGGRHEKRIKMIADIENKD